MNIILSIFVLSAILDLFVIIFLIKTFLDLGKDKGKIEKIETQIEEIDARDLRHYLCYMAKDNWELVNIFEIPVPIARYRVLVIHKRKETE